MVTKNYVYECQKQVLKAYIAIMEETNTLEHRSGGEGQRVGEGQLQKLMKFSGG